MLKAKKPMGPARDSAVNPKKPAEFLPDHLMRDIRENLARRKKRKSKEPED